VADDTAQILTTLSGQIGEVRGGVKAILATQEQHGKSINEISGRLGDVESEVQVVKRRIQSSPSLPPAANGTKAALFKWLPWLITAVITGAALGGAALAGGFGG
jgi:hypothetical protein